MIRNRTQAESAAIDMLSSYGAHQTTLVSVASLLLNALVLAVVLHQRRTDHRSWGQLHILSLAASDAFVGVVYLWGCMLRGSYGLPDLSTTQLSPNFLLHYNVWTAFHVGAIGVNQWLTLLFAVQQARAAASPSAAAAMTRRTPRRVATEIGVVGVGGGCVASALLFAAYRLLMEVPSKEELRRKSAAYVVTFVYVGVLAIVAAALAAYILHRLKDAEIKAANEFQSLVGVVGVVFCLFQIPFLADNLTALIHGGQRIDAVVHFSVFCNILSPAVGFFVYLASSKSFRGAVTKFLGRKWTRKRRDGSVEAEAEMLERKRRSGSLEAEA